MTVGASPNRLFATMAHYERIEVERRDPRRRLFISDYNGGHPFVEEYLGALATASPLELGDVTSYAGIDEDLRLRARIARLHRADDGADYGSEHVVPSGGSSALITTLCTWLMLAGWSEVHYLPPVYYKFAFLFDRFGIEPRPVADAHAFEPGFALRLPPRRTVLVLTDPIWYAGRRVPADVLDGVRRWQERTGSLVVVDGSFQYMRWDGGRAERSARLHPDLTLRIVSPTKYLSLHGYRCAHLLAPASVRDELADLHLNLHGDVTLADRLFAHRACDVMSGTGNGELVALMRASHRRLVDAGALTEHVAVETGYFVFGRIRRPHEDFLCLYAPSFELAGHRDYVRVNLLNGPALDALLDRL